MGWVGISTHSSSGSTTDAQVTPSLYFQSLAQLECDTAHSAGVHWAMGRGVSFSDITQRYNILFSHAKCSKPVHKSLNSSVGFCLCSLNPSHSWSCAVKWTLVALLTPPHPEHQQPGQSCHRPANHSTEQLLRDWSCISVGKLETPAIVFIF